MTSPTDTLPTSGTSTIHPMKQARQIARDLALLSLGQISNRALTQGSVSLDDLMTSAVRVLTSEANDLLENASSELQQGSDRLTSSQLNASNLLSASTMVEECMDLLRAAINRTALALELPEVLQMTNREEVRGYALEIVRCVKDNRADLDSLLNDSMESWTLNRLPKVDQDMLRIAVAEIKYLGVPHQIAIDEAMELAKRYSDEEGRRLLNGVLRRVLDRLDIRPGRASSSGLPKP